MQQSQQTINLKVIFHGQAVQLMVPAVITLRQLESFLYQNNILKMVQIKDAAFIHKQQFYRRDDFDIALWKNIYQGSSQEVTYLLNEEVQVAQQNLVDSNASLLPPFEQVQQDHEWQIKVFVLKEELEFGISPNNTLQELLKFLLDNNKVGVQNTYAFRNLHNNKIYKDLQLKIRDLQINNQQIILKFMPQEDLDEIQQPLQQQNPPPIIQQPGQKITFKISLKDGDRNELIMMDFINTQTIDQIRDTLYKYYKYDPAITGLDLYYNRMNLQDMVKRARTVAELNIPDQATLELHVRWIGG